MGAWRLSFFAPQNPCKYFLYLQVLKRLNATASYTEADRNLASSLCLACGNMIAKPLAVGGLVKCLGVKGLCKRE